MAQVAKYKYIRAWVKYNKGSDLILSQLLEQAIEEKASEDAVYYSAISRKWIEIHAIQNTILAGELKRLAAVLESDGTKTSANG